MFFLYCWCNVAHAYLFLRTENASCTKRIIYWLTLFSIFRSASYVLRKTFRSFLTAREQDSSPEFQLCTAASASTWPRWTPSPTTIRKTSTFASDPASLEKGSIITSKTMVSSNKTILREKKLIIFDLCTYLEVWEGTTHQIHFIQL